MSCLPVSSLLKIISFFTWILKGLAKSKPTDLHM
jgi:hypothetical protein